MTAIVTVTLIKAKLAALERNDTAKPRSVSPSVESVDSSHTEHTQPRSD